MSETTATVRIRTHNRFVDGNWRFVLEWPSGATTSGYDLADLERLGLPVPSKPIPDPPEGCNRVIDCDGDQWTRMLCNPNVWEFGISKRGWAQLVDVYGPVTPLIPGDPIEAP